MIIVMLCSNPSVAFDDANGLQFGNRICTCIDAGLVFETAFWLTRGHRDSQRVEKIWIPAIKAEWPLP